MTAPILTDHFATLAPNYDAILSDVWGVVHNGVAATPPACEALTRFRDKGGSVVLISNAPRPGEGVIKFLDHLKVPRSVYDGIVTYNCDKYQEDHVGWWDAVDVISSSGYYPVDDWENQLDRIEPVVAASGKPFFFMEAGCRSANPCSTSARTGRGGKNRKPWPKRTS